VTWTPEIYPQVRKEGRPFGAKDFIDFTCVFSRSSQEIAVKIAALTLIVEFHSEWQTIDIERQ
jgi:hypothetical protein